MGPVIVVVIVWEPALKLRLANASSRLRAPEAPVRRVARVNVLGI